MKRNRSGSRKRRESIQVWTYDQTRRVLPYVASIMRSLREHCLEAQQHNLAAYRLGKRPGRPDRTAILAHTRATEEAKEAEERFHEALDELHTLDIYCLDPVAGLALIPFAKDDRLAWFVFDLFDESDAIRFWRFHQDPLEQRRPIAEALTGPPGNPTIV
ncbi:MAG TPA: DUF2203 family protein [Gemmataceae bacterium]|nr:DUF2203 family protein [Gemmataceae bacterium]